MVEELAAWAGSGTGPHSLSGEPLVSVSVLCKAEAGVLQAGCGVKAVLTAQSAPLTSPSESLTSWLSGGGGRAGSIL